MASETCLRCGAAMEWRHQTWQCPRCRFKIGCCEGDAGCDFGSEGGDRAVASPRQARGAGA